MKIKIDIYSKDPIYKQITDYIEKLVHDGQMPAGMILSRQLIQCHNPFRMTRRKTF